MATWEPCHEPTKTSAKPPTATRSPTLSSVGSTSHSSFTWIGPFPFARAPAPERGVMAALKRTLLASTGSLSSRLDVPTPSVVCEGASGASLLAGADGAPEDEAPANLAAAAACSSDNIANTIHGLDLSPEPASDVGEIAVYTCRMAAVRT